MIEHYAWKAIVKEGQLEEYKRRHDNIWPELKALLKSAGIRNSWAMNFSDITSARRESILPQKLRQKVKSLTAGTNT